MAPLNLMPKSPSAPAGLCDAVRMKPPSAFCPPGPPRLRMMADTAGVDSSPSLPDKTGPGGAECVGAATLMAGQC